MAHRTPKPSSSISEWAERTVVGSARVGALMLSGVIHERVVAMGTGLCTVINGMYLYIRIQVYIWMLHADKDLRWESCRL